MRPKALLGEECASRRHDCNRHDEIVEADVCFGDGVLAPAAVA
jgi:hypothetical protein